MTYEWQHSRAATAAGIIAAYSGVDPVNPIDAAAGQITSSETRSIVAPSVSTKVRGAVLVGLHAIDELATIAPGPALAERVQIATHEARHELTVALSDAQWPTPGSTGEQRASADLPGRSIGQTVVLRPAN